MFRRRGWLNSVGLVVALVVAGCASNDPPGTGGPSSDADRPRAETPQDRDEKAVLATLQRLDLCAVLRSAAATASTSPAGEPSAQDPFSCDMDGTSVSISQLGTDARLKLPVRAIGNAKAYVDYTTPNYCFAYFPISFELVVKFQLSRENAECGPLLDGVLAAATTTLTEPTATTAAPRWDACSALAKALGDDADPRELLWAGSGVGAVCERWEPSLAHLEFGYGNPLIGATTTETIGGAQVEVQEVEVPEGTVCRVAWRVGAADSPDAAQPDLWAAAAAQDCDQAKRLAVSVMAVLTSPPPDVTAQRPLLYGADEPDTPFTGGCAHLERNIAKHCRPFVEMSVPDGKAAILRAADTEADTQCAVARDAIKERFGTKLTPVAVDIDGLTSCYFVEPERQLQIQFQLRSGPVNGVPDVFTVREATIAGLPGYVENSPHQREYQVWVGLSADPADDGGLNLTVSGGPATRGAGPPADTATKTELALTDILNEHFS